MTTGAAWNLGELAHTAERDGTMARARATIDALADAGPCPVCEYPWLAAVGAPPDQPRRGHDRGCPLRGPGWRTPARVPRVEWTDPAEAAAVLAPGPADRQERIAQARQLRAAGASLRAIAARLGVSKATASVWTRPDAPQR